MEGDRRSNLMKTAIALWLLGSVSLLTSFILLFFKISAELKHGNVGSSPYWINPPYTDFERFILHFPVLWFGYFAAGCVLIGCISVFLAKRRK